MQILMNRTEFITLHKLALRCPFLLGVTGWLHVISEIYFVNPVQKASYQIVFCLFV